MSKTDYIIRPIHEVFKGDSLKYVHGLIHKFKPVFDAGGWLAGGFARVLLRESDITEYLTAKGGDIDFFFPDSQTATASATRCWPPPGAGASPRHSTLFTDTLNIHIGNVLAIGPATTTFGNVPVQFVTEPMFCYKGGPIECLESFDFVNCKVAFDAENVYYHKDWKEVESKNQLKIVNIDCPFMGSRVVKYYDRGVTSLHPDSVDLLSKWLVKASFGNFKKFEKATSCNKKAHYLLLKRAALHKVKALANLSLIEKEYFTFFIGKFQEVTNEWSGEPYKSAVIVTTTDWAVKKIQESSKAEM